MLPKKQDEMNKDYDRFIEAWGTISQILKTQDEMHELGSAFCRELLSREFAERGHHNFYQEPSFEELLGEIADVYLTIDEMSYVFGRARIKEIIASKLEKALQRVEEFEEALNK